VDEQATFFINNFFLVGRPEQESWVELEDRRRDSRSHNDYGNNDACFFRR
jgi:hypothetical protein